LTRDHQAAIDEIKSLQTALADRDHAVRRQAEHQQAQIESYSQSHAHDRQRDRDAIERLEAELATLGERHKRDTEDLNARDDLFAQLRGRVRELENAQEAIKSEYQSAIEVERTKREELAQQLREQRNKRDAIGTSLEQSVSTDLFTSETSHAISATLQSALTQVEDLKQWLTESERLNRDMAALLESVGIKYSPPARH
jgi:hypothetical protein